MVYSYQGIPGISVASTVHVTAVDPPPRQLALSGQCDWHWVSLGKKEKVAGGHNKQDVGLSCTSPLLQLRTVTGTRAGGTCTRQVPMHTDRPRKRANPLLRYTLQPCYLPASLFPSPSLLPPPTPHTSSPVWPQTLLLCTDKGRLPHAVNCPRDCSNGVCSFLGQHGDAPRTAALGWHH